MDVVFIIQKLTGSMRKEEKGREEERRTNNVITKVEKGGGGRGEVGGGEVREIGFVGKQREANNSFNLLPHSTHV